MGEETPAEDFGRTLPMFVSMPSWLLEPLGEAELLIWRTLSFSTGLSSGPAAAAAGSSASGASGDSASSKAHKSSSVVSLARFPIFGRCRGGREDPSGDGGGRGVMVGSLVFIKVRTRTWPVRRPNPKFRKNPVASNAL